MTTLVHRVFVDDQVVPEDRRDTLAVELGRLLDLDPVEIDRRLLARPGARYVVVADPVTDAGAEAVRGAGLRGVGVESRPQRHYPHGATAQAILGMVGFEHTGLGGLEHAFDGELGAEPGRLTYLRDARRHALWIQPADYRPARPGGDVRLGLDLVVQEIAERRLREAVLAQNAGGGRLVVLDCRTGELLAMCDVLNPRPGWDEPIEDPRRAALPALARNRCVTDPYEPGSTFKPFVWAVATELGAVHPGEILDTPADRPHVTSFGRRIRDTFYHEDADWETVLIKSLNSGMAIAAERMSHAQMQSVVARFGFGRRTGSGLPGESAGLVTPRGAWSDYTQTSVSFGHEIAVTPLQMVVAFSAFARDGTLPQLRVTAADPRVPAPPIVHRVLSPGTARAARDVLRRVMTEGSGRRAQSERYELFGKSGTPQLPKRDGGGYHEDRYVPSFIAGAPYDEPRVVVLCVLDDPDRSRGHYGGRIAAPVVRDVVDEVLAYLGVPPRGAAAAP